MTRFQRWLVTRNYWRLTFYLLMALVLYKSWLMGADIAGQVGTAVVMWAIYRLGYEVSIKDRKLKNLKEGKNEHE